MNDTIYLVVNQNTINGSHEVNCIAYRNYADALREAQAQIEQAINEWKEWGRAFVNLFDKQKGECCIFEEGYADTNEQIINIKTIHVL